jgi:hypothetical protein
MSAPVPLYSPDVEVTRHGLLAAVSVVIATCSVAVTLAVAGGGGGTDEPATAAGPRFATGPIGSGTVDPPGPATAQPDAATLYRNGVMIERRR